MDLWQVFARLRHRPIGLVAVLVVAIALGLLGWLGTSKSYTVTASQALRVQSEQAGTALPSGSFELGVIGSMVAQNLNTAVAGSLPDGSVTGTNAVVSPPTALPLISMTATASTPEAATATMRAAQSANVKFLEKVVGTEPGSPVVSLVTVANNAAPAASNQPRIRAGGAGFILGLLVGLLALIVIDTLKRSRRGTHSSGIKAHGDRRSR